MINSVNRIQHIQELLLDIFITQHEVVDWQIISRLRITPLEFNRAYNALPKILRFRNDKIFICRENRISAIKARLYHDILNRKVEKTRREARSH